VIYLLKSLIIRGDFDDMEEVVRIAKTEGRKLFRVEKVGLKYLSPLFLEGEVVWVAVISNGIEDSVRSNIGCKTPLVVGEGSVEKQK